MLEKSEKEIRELVKKAKKGEAEAFGLIYDQYLERIYRFIYLKVSNREEAEDLSQQVFLKAWEAIYRFEDEGLPFTSWLYRIARNLVIDFYRTKKQNIALEENIAIEAVKNSEEKILENDEKEELIRALKELTEEQKDVIILRFIEGLSYKEIAKITKKNQPALRILQYRALNKLRKILKKEQFPSI